MTNLENINQEIYIGERVLGFLYWLNEVYLNTTIKFSVKLRHEMSNEVTTIYCITQTVAIRICNNQVKGQG